jgi:DNA-binding MarR family transcriptional regulator
MNHSSRRKESVTPASPQPEPEIEAAVDELVALMARERAGRLRGWCRRPISSTHLNVLVALEADGPLTMSRLAEILELALPNATGIVTRMEEHGLVSRGRDETDRRLVLVQLTESGRQLVEERAFMRRAHLIRILAAMPATRRDELVRALGAFLDTARRLRACGELSDEDPLPMDAPDASPSARIAHPTSHQGATLR